MISAFKVVQPGAPEALPLDGARILRLQCTPVDFSLVAAEREQLRYPFSLEDAVSFPLILTIAYAAVAAYELYLFLMQRSALEIGRERGIDKRAARHMLPLWYASVWPAKLTKWVLLFLIYRTAGWQPALLLWGVPFVLSVVIPVPHGQFFPIFRRKLSGDMGTEHEGPAAELMVALLATRKR